MNRLLFAMTCAVGLCAGAAPVYTVTLPSGTTNTLGEAFSNGYVASDDDQETPSYDGLLAAADLRVAGGGRLEINKDLKGGGYTGEVHVVAGAILRITANGALGDTAHGTFVADGATLENECLVDENNKLDFANESLSFAGTGVGGLGALIARTPKRQERNGVWGGTKLTMTGDAMISTVTGYQDFPCNSANNSLDMNGHTLTVRGFDTATGNTPGSVCLRPVITNPGHIVITNCGASINDSANLGGDAKNTFTLADRSTLELYSSTTAGKKKWTLLIPASNQNKEPLKSSQNGGVWDGPVLADRDLPMVLNSQQSGEVVYTNNSAFFGKVEVDGDFSVRNANPAFSLPSLKLVSDENAFYGSFSVGELVTLKVDSAAALACATATVAATSSIVLNPEVTDYRLPVVVIKGESSIVSGGGRCEGLIKDGAGDLAYENLLDISNLVLNAGSMSYSPLTNDVVFYAGLSYGMDTNFTKWSSGERKSNQAFYDENIATVTNKVVLDFSDIKPLAAQHQGYFGGTGTYYDGYLWNPSSAKVTWRIAICADTRAWLKVNDVKLTAAQYAVAFGNFTLNPGINRFVFHIGTQSSECYVNKHTNVVSWADNVACAYCTTPEKVTSKTEDPADFQPLVDPGDGSVLRCVIESSNLWNERGAAWSNANVMASTRFAGSAGTTLNLANRALRTAKLEGCPMVTKAAETLLPTRLDVTENWTVDGNDLAKGAKLDCEQAIVFAEGSTVSITNGRALAKSGKVAIAVSDEAIVGLPTFLPVDRYQFEITKSADGKTLYAEYVPRGMMILLR